MDKILTPLEIAQAIQEVFATLTVEKARQYIAEDFVIKEARSLPFGGEWRGPEGFVGLMKAIPAAFPNFHFEPGPMVTDGKTMVVFSATISGDTPHGRFEQPFVEYWICRDGKVVSALPFWHDTKAVMDLYNGLAPAVQPNDTSAGI
jgi:ketosteroid isomerase-like protein